MRRLIINADDLGLTTGVNRGIRECLQYGIATSATLMANAAAFGDAVEVMRRSADTAPTPHTGPAAVSIDAGAT